MRFQDQLVVNLIASSGEAYVLLRTALPDRTFKQVFSWAFGLNFAALATWSVFIWPLLFNPLRHVPLAKVRPPLHNYNILSYRNRTNILQGRLNHARMLFDSPRGKTPLNWIRTIPNEGLIHFRDTLNRSFLMATSHQALLDIMSTNTYDFEKPWLVRNFLARIIGFGLILSEGGAHRKQRKALTPAFNIKNIRALYPLMWEKTGILLSQLEDEIKANPSGFNLAGNIELSVWARSVLPLESLRKP
jgi:hypothetical protein